ncbi:MAG: peptide chain release factor 2 [Spirochaetia bacterium]|nr:peptide chain release factor 2 [Spirochaetia bacterium]
MDIKEIRQSLVELKERASKIRCIFDVAHKTDKVLDLEQKTQMPDFWKDNNAAKAIQSQLKAFKDDIETTKEIKRAIENVEVSLQLLDVEKDSSLEKDLIEKFPLVEKLIHKAEFTLMFSGPHDRSNAIVTIHAGAGGTESCDWAQMLLRMYMMWCEKKGFDVSIVDSAPGDGAGLKNVTMEVTGGYAYGHFRAEKGVHRLVRISPFDSNKRRHTSFASLECIPEIDDEIVVDIRDDDLKVDTYRASGAGGQHINKTESAVRITHIPTGVVVSCQMERSQMKNRDTAMKMLKSKLYAMQEEQMAQRIEQLAGEKKTIGWGMQIRSYVLHPYKMIKDLRTGVERGDVDNVLDGDLDVYIEAFLKMEAEERSNAKNKI